MSYSLDEDCFKFIKERITIVNNPLMEFFVYVTHLELQLFQPIGESHHNANLCPYCRENLNGKT